MPVEPRRSRRSNLGCRARTNVDPQRQAVAGQHSARYVVEVHQRAAARLRKGANHFPRRLLGLHSQARAAAGSCETKFQASVQLMNKRVSSELCRIDPSSGSGVKHATSSVSESQTAFVMAGLRFQIKRLAAS